MNDTSAPSPHGVICPIVTPLDTEEGLDEAVLRRLVTELLPAVDGLMLLGTTGELPVLDPVVADRLVEVALEETAGARTQIVLGVGGTGWAQTRRNLQRVSSGIDAVAVSMPYYYPTAPRDLHDHIERVIEHSDVPVVLYNIPQNTHQEFDLDVVAQLAQHERVIGMKDSGPDTAYFSRLLELRSPTFSVLRGTDLSHADTYREAGADGFVNGIENMAPGITRGVLDAETSQGAKTTLSALEVEAGGPYGLARIKAGVALRHGGIGRTAGALASLDAQEVERVRASLGALGVGPAVDPAVERTTSSRPA